MSIYDQDGRLRILFIDAYDTLARRGVVSPEQAEAVKDLVDRLEELTPEELDGRLAALFPDRSPAAGPGSGEAPAGSEPAAPGDKL
jgi:hypothetical protein